MSDRPDMTPGTRKLETVEPLGMRVLIRKDADRKQTKSGIHLPDKIEIPTLTGRVVAISAMIEHDLDYPVQQYDKVLFNPNEALPVDFEGDNRLFVVPVENVVAVFRRNTANGEAPRESSPDENTEDQDATDEDATDNDVTDEDATDED